MVQICMRGVGSRCFHRAFVLVEGKAKKVAGGAQASSEVRDAVRFRYYNNQSNLFRHPRIIPERYTFHAHSTPPPLTSPPYIHIATPTATAHPVNPRKPPSVPTTLMQSSIKEPYHPTRVPPSPSPKVLCRLLNTVTAKIHHHH